MAVPVVVQVMGQRERYCRKSWQPCQLDKPANRLAWQHWRAELSFPEKGYYEVWARATDSKGIMQPMLVPGWNPKGYLNNACHRIAVKVV